MVILRQEEEGTVLFVLETKRSWRIHLQTLVGLLEKLVFC